MKPKIYGRNHPDRSPFPAVRINGLDYVLPSVDAEFPPVYWANCDVSPGPEEQRSIGEKGNKHCGPNPDVLANVLFCFITIAYPAPVLWRYAIIMRPNDITERTDSLQQELRRNSIRGY